jgi:hypothetical protein
LQREANDLNYLINYGFGSANLYTPSEDWESRFYELANQCFGIRKSIMCAELVLKKDIQPANMLTNEYERLEHSGDVIVWDKEGNKIKSEFDD